MVIRTDTASNEVRNYTVEIGPDGTRRISAADSGRHALHRQRAVLLGQAVPFCHSVRHVFVLAGNLLHYWAVSLYVFPGPVAA